ncbi:MAG: UDP-N-acetylmuramoyl-L-alanyl-D-glutamate--2,6-diaminopimelate ligase [Candidatus Aureabacteria bacterium]|nr:UDP-N-acetylmuramoyl-L-alanyl-D-glutamate--2,6-diaminopimelate ligase [Candidatus Auribacterota bacterium]
MRLEDIFQGSSLRNETCAQFDIKDVQTDSRQASDGSLFIAVPGLTQNGCDYVQDAISRGAIAIVSEIAMRVPEKVHLFLSKNIRLDIPVIAANWTQRAHQKLALYGVTGTKGKTTSVMMLHAILNKAGKESGYITTIERHWKNKTLPSSLTTPGPLELHRDFASMVRVGCDSCVFEVSSHGIDQRRHHGLRFESRIMTNVQSDHLDYHNTLEAYRETKASFLTEAEDEYSVLNLDDSIGMRISKKKKKKSTYAVFDRSADLVATNISQSPEKGLSWEMIYHGKKWEMCAPNLFGLFMVENALAAIGAALIANIEYQAIREALYDFVPPLGRLTRIEGIDLFSVYIDYAHTSDSLEKTLIALKPLAKNKMRLVFGCGGNRDKTKRSEMGRIAVSLADYVYLTSDNSRWEETSSILEDIKKGMGSNGPFFCSEDRQTVINQVIEDGQEGDVILIAGKGHETYQEMKGIRFPFSDWDAVKKAWIKRKRTK